MTAIRKNDARNGRQIYWLEINLVGRNNKKKKVPYFRE